MIRLGCCALTFALFTSSAIGAEWAPWPSPDGSPLVASGFRHDDGGTLLVICDKQKRLMSIMLNEPRATWKEGERLPLQTRGDDGSQMKPSTAIVLAPTRVVVTEESTWDIYTMAKSRTYFATGIGGYARVWPLTTFKKATGPVLEACGDKLPD